MSKNKISKDEKLLKALKENVGEWTCSYCSSGAGQPARNAANLRGRGYQLEEYRKGVWAKSMHCPNCSPSTDPKDNRSHYKLISTEPLTGDKKRNGWSEEERERIISILGKKDVFTGATITSSVPEIDHKTPISRRKDKKVKDMTDEEIKEELQITTRQNNLLKEKACKKCVKTGKRQSYLKINYWWVGDEKYVSEECGGCGCKGCYWHDPVMWAKKVNENLT